MSVLPRFRLVLGALFLLLVCSECFPSKRKTTESHHKRTAKSHPKSHVKSSKKDSVRRANNQAIMAAVMHPGKLDITEEKELNQLQDFNKAFINNEMAAETSLLANQGIDDDAALGISNMAALPSPLRGVDSKTKISDMRGDTVSLHKPSVAGYNPDEYLLDANSWPEYKIRDSDYSSRNYRVFPQGQNEGGYQGGGLMPYGARGGEGGGEGGMEGPYGDGNYGFPQPPQMVSDNPAASQGATQGDTQGDTQRASQDEGSQITMQPQNNRIVKLVMKSHKKITDKENFNDEKLGTFKIPNNTDTHRTHSSGEGSGSGEESGTSDVSQKPKETQNSSGPMNVPNVVDVKGGVSANLDTGKQAVDTTPGKGDTAGGSGSEGDGNVSNQNGNKGGNREGAKQIGDNLSVTLKQSPPNNDKPSLQTGKSSSNEPRDSNNKVNSAPESSSPKGASAVDIANALSHAQGDSPLGQFAEFLKSKGISLTVNKADKAGSKTSSPKEQTSANENQSNSPQSPPSMTAGPQSDGKPATNGPITLNPSESNEQQSANSNNVMNWQNIGPQSASMAGLYQRHDTKQKHN